MSKTFLQAEWRKLIMANYALDKNILTPYLPPHTELDLWNDTCYVSLVGFMFKNTKLKGFKIPFHINFEEVNLRFYVRYKDQNLWKRGVVFIKEIVPKPALTFVANTLYKEKYETLPMQHIWLQSNDALTVEYLWKKRRWNSLKIITSPSPNSIHPDSEEAFITDHYWGYSKVNQYQTFEYEVEHPQWHVYPTQDYSIDVDFGHIYGADFDFLSAAEPLSVFLAEGSEIKVNNKRALL